MTEEDRSEERSARESGKEEIYVRDKKNCTTLETFRFRSLLRAYHLYLLQSIYILTTLRFIHHTYYYAWFRLKNRIPSHLDSDENSFENESQILLKENPKDHENYLTRDHPHQEHETSPR